MYNRSVTRRVMRKDADAFRILYDDWAEKIYAYAYDILGSGELASRAVGLCFSEAYIGAQSLSDESQMEGWLMGVCANATAKVAMERRVLGDAEKERLWQELSQNVQIVTLESVQAEQPPDEEKPTGEAAKKEPEDWQPIIFLPEEEDIQPTPAEHTAVIESPKKTGEKSKRPRSSRKTAAIFTGALVVIGAALAGGAAVLALASTGVIQLPASLSGAATAIAAIIAG